MNRLTVYSYLTRFAYGHAGFGRLFTGHLADKEVLPNFRKENEEPEFRTNPPAAAPTEDRLSRIWRRALNEPESDNYKSVRSSRICIPEDGWFGVIWIINKTFVMGHGTLTVKGYEIWVIFHLGGGTFLGIKHTWDISEPHAQNKNSPLLSKYHCPSHLVTA